jgi:hypothetical protein
MPRGAARDVGRDIRATPISRLAGAVIVPARWGSVNHLTNAADFAASELLDDEERTGSCQADQRSAGIDPRLPAGRDEQAALDQIGQPPLR